jgi:predicted Fe-S protein YdhL (DUF1289 family)
MIGAMESPMNSPCVKTCLFDAASGFCSGCGRTLEEIADWPYLRDEDRNRIMAELPGRLESRRPESGRMKNLKPG